MIAPRLALAALAFAALTATLCAPMLGNGPLGDDLIWLYDASQVRGMEDLFTVHDVPFAPYDGVRLNPTTSLFFAVGWRVFGTDPGGLHAVVLGLYVLTALLLAQWLLDLGLQVWPALAAAALFLLYPLHAEPLAWLSATGEVLFGGLAPSQVHDWYESLSLERAGPRDRFVFYDERKHVFRNLTSGARRSHDALQGRLPPGQRARDAVERAAEWTADALGSWSATAEVSRDGARFRTSGNLGWLRSPPLDLSPFAGYAVELRFVQREGRGFPMVGWATEDAGDISSDRVISWTDEMPRGPGAVRTVRFLTPSSAPWWTGGRIRSLFLVPSSEAGLVEIQAVRLYTFGSLR